MSLNYDNIFPTNVQSVILLVVLVFFKYYPVFISTLYNTKNIPTLLLTSNNEHKNLICCIFIYIYVSFYLDTVENTIYNDDGEIFKFTMLSSTLVKHFPSEKLDKLKFLIKSKFSHLYNLKLLIKTKWYFSLLQLLLRL